MRISICDGGPKLWFSHLHGEREFLVSLSPEEPMELVDTPHVKRRYAWCSYSKGSWELYSTILLWFLWLVVWKSPDKYFPQLRKICSKKILKSFRMMDYKYMATHMKVNMKFYNSYFMLCLGFNKLQLWEGIHNK